MVCPELLNWDSGTVIERLILRCIVFSLVLIAAITKLIKAADGEKEIMLKNTLVVQLLFTMFFINLETNSSKETQYPSLTTSFNIYTEVQGTPVLWCFWLGSCHN